MNPNNCSTCEWKAYDDKGHCYMFFDEPTEVCMQHTARKQTTLAVGAGSNLSFLVMLAHTLVDLSPLDMAIHDNLCSTKDGGICDCHVASMVRPEL